MVSSSTLASARQSTGPSRFPKVRLGSVPTDSEDELKFLQQRLSLYAATVAILSGLFLVVGMLSHLVVHRSYFQDPDRPPHIVGTGIAVLLWLITRQRRTLSLATLMWIDAVGTVSMSLAFVLMAHLIPGAIGTLVGTLALSYVALGRAAQVPSTPRRTFVLSTLAFAGLMASVYLHPIPAEYPQSPAGRLFSTLDPLVWSIAGTALATVASKVIYGLQEKVIEARQLGQYTLEAKIGEGGMGEIYRARHAMLRRPTAIKLLPGEHSETQIRRFEREVQLTASLSHPNTICVFDYGRTPEGIFYYAMELLNGLNLETLVEQHGPQPPGRVVHILRQVCGALTEAHGVGLIHRDIKPANIYLCRHGGLDDFIKVLDFGLVRQVDTDASLSQSTIQVLVGTPLYMAPESILSPESLDARADLYSLGATAYHLLTGSPPFQGNSVVEVAGHHLHTEPESLTSRLGQPLPEALSRAVLDCLAKDPAARPKSAAALAERLDHAQGIAPWTPDDALRFWQSEYHGTEHRLALGTGRTMRVDLEERAAESARDWPETG